LFVAGGSQTTPTGIVIQYGDQGTVPAK